MNSMYEREATITEKKTPTRNQFRTIQMQPI